MKVSESGVSKCLYYEQFISDLADWDWVYDDCEIQSSGSGKVYLIAKESASGKHVIVEYDVGSCPHCDEFEGMSEEQLLEERTRLRICFDSRDQFKAFAERYTRNSDYSETIGYGHRWEAYQQLCEVLKRLCSD